MILVSQEFVANVTVWDTFSVDTIDLRNSYPLCDVKGNYDIAFTPDSSAAMSLVSELAKDMQKAVNCPILPIENITEIIDQRMRDLQNITANLNNPAINLSPRNFTNFNSTNFNWTSLGNRTDLSQVRSLYEDFSDLFEAKIFTPMPFDSMEDMNTYIVENSNSTNVFMGLLFADSWKNATTFPNNLDYSLRPPAAPRSEQSSSGFASASGWVTNLLFPTRPASDGPRSRNSKVGGKPHYYQEGFLTAQHRIDINFLKVKSNELGVNFSEYGYQTNFQRFSYPPYPSDPYINLIGRNLPFIILLWFMYLAAQTAKSVAIEKDTGLKAGLKIRFSTTIFDQMENYFQLRLKEYMLMMGLSRTSLWTSYFIHYFCMFLVSVSIVTIVLCTAWSENGSIINYTHWSIVYVLLILYGISLINMGFMISTWFKSANAVAATTAVLITIFFIPYNMIENDMDGTPTSGKIILSVLSPVAMSFGFSQISAWESRAIGIQWSNICDPVSSSNQMTMLQMYLMLIFDILLYYALARYIDVVNPGKWGVARKWYFLCSPSYWCPGQSRKYRMTMFILCS